MTKVHLKPTKKVTPLKAPSASSSTAAKIHMKKNKKVTVLKEPPATTFPTAAKIHMKKTKKITQVKAASASSAKVTAIASRSPIKENKSTKEETTPTSASPNSKGGSGGIGAPQRILNLVLSLETKYRNPSVDRAMIISMAGIKATTFPVTLSNLKKQGLIEYDKTSIRLTTKGREKATVVDIPDNESIQQELKAKHKLGGKQGKLFDMLLDGESHDRAHVAESVGYTNKATFAVALSNMKKMGIIEYDKHTIKLTDICFPFGRP